MKMRSVYLALLPILTGCAAHIPALDSAQDMPPRAELTSTPFFPQEREQCGPAALATVLNFYGHSTTPDALRQWVYVPERGGSLQVEMLATARRHDMLAYPLAGELPALLREIAAGHPVLVLQNLGLTWLPRWHYAVVIGYDIDERRLILRSGTEFRWKTDFGVFMHTWRRAGAWALVIIPPDQSPATIERKPWLQAAADLETTQHHSAAYRAFTTATTLFPDDTHAWLGRANNALHLGDAQHAADHFITALGLQPQHPIAWNNLGYALQALNCSNQAQQAVDCAVTLAPVDTRFVVSKQDIHSRPHSSRNAACPALPACPAASVLSTP